MVCMLSLIGLVPLTFLAYGLGYIIIRPIYPMFYLLKGDYKFCCCLLDCFKNTTGSFHKEGNPNTDPKLLQSFVWDPQKKATIDLGKPQLYKPQRSYGELCWNPREFLLPRKVQKIQGSGIPADLLFGNWLETSTMWPQALLEASKKCCRTALQLKVWRQNWS